MTEKAVRLGKSAALKHWRGLEPGQALEPSPVPYRHEGSTYAEDGIRITGSRGWVDSVLSRLQDLLGAENGETRLQINYGQSTDRETGLPMAQVSLDSWSCYVQVHQRGGQARIANALAGRLITG